MVEYSGSIVAAIKQKSRIPAVLAMDGALA